MRYDTIRYDTIHKRFTTAIYRRAIKWANMPCVRRGAYPGRTRGGRRGGVPVAPSSAIRQRRPSPACGGSHRPRNRDDDAVVRARPSRYLEGRGKRRRPTRRPVRRDVCSLSQPRPYRANACLGSEVVWVQSVLTYFQQTSLASCLIYARHKHKATF